MPTSPPTNPTYYEILNLSPSTLSSQEDQNPNTTASLLKRAYRRALLTHHPDKTKTKNSPHPTPLHQGKKEKFTIDQISTAYATLSRPTQRQAYDRSLLLQSQSHSLLQIGGGTGTGTGTGTEFQTGIESIDLDDLDYEENGTNTTWYRSCRCGNPRGYHFTEADLVDAGDVGELMVGCVDCSLWLRVYFAVVEDDDDEGDGGQPAEDGSGGETKEGRDLEAGAAAGGR
jgi:curved DNA-binding protein CbpA